MKVNHLTCYFDPGNCEPYCVNVESDNGNDEFHFNTPQAAGKYVADWLTLAQLKTNCKGNQTCQSPQMK